MTRHARSQTWRLLILLALGACSAPPQQGLIDHYGRDDLSAKELRAQIRESFERRLSAIALTTNAALAETADETLRQHALIFRLRAASEFHSLSILPDPYASLVEQWGFTLQLSNFLRSERAIERLGALQPLYQACAESLVAIAEEELSEIVLETKQALTRERLEAWAIENPIDELNLSRRGIWAELAKLVGDSDAGLFGVAASLQNTIDDIVERLSLQMQFLPFQLRWTADQYLESLQVEPRAEMLLERLASYEQSLERLSSIEDRLPALLTEQRRAVFEESRPEIDRVLAAVSEERRAVATLVATERETTLAFANAQLDEMLSAISDQRLSTLSEVERQRVATLTWAQAERALLLESVDQRMLRVEEQLALMLNSGDAIAERRIQQVLWGVGILGGVFLVLGSCIAWLLLGRARASRR